MHARDGDVRNIDHSLTILEEKTPSMITVVNIRQAQGAGTWVSDINCSTMPAVARTDGNTGDGNSLFTNVQNGNSTLYRGKPVTGTLAGRWVGLSMEDARCTQGGIPGHIHGGCTPTMVHPASIQGEYYAPHTHLSNLRETDVKTRLVTQPPSGRQTIRRASLPTQPQGDGR